MNNKMLNKKTLYMPYYVFTSVDDCKLVLYSLALLQCAPFQLLHQYKSERIMAYTYPFGTYIPFLKQ